MKNALWAEKSVRTNVCCESNITNVLDPLNAFRDLMFLFLDEKARVHSWELFGDEDHHPSPPPLPAFVGKEKCIFALDQAWTYQDVALCGNNCKTLLSEGIFVCSSAIYGFVVCKGTHKQKHLEEGFIDCRVNVCKGRSVFVYVLYVCVKRGHRERLCNGIG